MTDVIELGFDNELSLDEIDELLATPVKERGVIKSMTTTFIAQNKLALDFTERFPQNKPNSLKASVKLNIDKHFADKNLRIMLAGEAPEEGEEDTRHVILINLDVHAALKAAQADGENETAE